MLISNVKRYSHDMKLKLKVHFSLSMNRPIDFQPHNRSAKINQEPHSCFHIVKNKTKFRINHIFEKSYSLIL